MRILARAIAVALQLAALAAPAMVSAARSAQSRDVPRELVFGRWTDNADCSKTIEFRRDGTFVAPTGEGLWAISEGRIIFQGSRTIAAGIEMPDADTIKLFHDDGTVGRSTRCGRPPPAAAAIVLTPAFLVGAWTDDDDCEETIEFLADGTFVAPTGEGTWRLEGDLLTFVGSQTVSARAQAADEETILLIHPDSTLGRSTRCPSAMPAAPAVTAAASPERVRGAA
ncbi:MAG: hypothetical protein QOI38_2516 [Sphingomonadales bacterium]|jgi:hypothetical protein|nr:hypothetical protein [Sphingomonadales bacterium]